MNYSIYGIPAYWVLSLFPHVYAQRIIKNASNGHWDNRNPRGVDLLTQYKRSVPAAAFAKFERARATHNNGMENMALFIGAVVVGNMAKLESSKASGKESTLNTVVGSFPALRVVYTALYITITNKKYSLARSTVWAISTLLLFYPIVKAANMLVYQTDSA
ncbi:uncharacterized protein BDZ99DRAFT_513475 [Mytilinidion resinicola]|uniref:Membrane-associated proteins in eicosanoid and glutathione metabolism n=1 Tax=Mytilinidion resinicola TaxID=574789 RepID=A0A6A6Z7Z4_9PEZI|nr:uncharacterized protein BDZ99DRAFT_513475 [Mytilinidion resinicola]KAF2817231.1 hypothetical protein BDZ99DRAFT_513475 [Mytilinidion resinicola]